MQPSPIDWTCWQAEMLATLMFIVRDEQVLLIEKKRGLGAGKINGPGGKIEPGESPLQAAIRETQEELCITPKSPRKLGELWFSMSDFPDILCHVFRADHFTGTPTETDEAVPLWSPLAHIPYHRMWEDDRHWLPIVLDNRSFLGRFVFAGEQMLWHEVLSGHWESDKLLTIDDEGSQGLLDFETGNSNGFDNWRRQREARLLLIRREWAVPVGKRVCLKLREYEHEFTGILMLAEEPTKIDRSLPLRLKIRNVPLVPADIEHCTVLD